MKLPRRIHYGAALPRDPNGLLLRKRLQRDAGVERRRDARSTAMHAAVARGADNGR